MTNRKAQISTAVAALLLAGAAACSTSDLLDVETPDQITPEQAESAVGAASLRASALGMSHASTRTQSSPASRAAASPASSPASGPSPLARSSTSAWPSDR